MCFSSLFSILNCSNCFWVFSWSCCCWSINFTRSFFSSKARSNCFFESFNSSLKICIVKFSCSVVFSCCSDSVPLSVPPIFSLISFKSRLLYSFAIYLCSLVVSFIGTSLFSLIILLICVLLVSNSSAISRIVYVCQC